MVSKKTFSHFKCKLPTANALSLYSSRIFSFDWLVAWLVVLGFNATLTAKVISWRSVTHMCFLAFSHQYEHNFPFQSHRLLFSHASAEVKGKNTPERKFASTGDQTYNHQVMSPTPLSHPGGAFFLLRVKSLPNNKNIHLSKLKAFAEDKINVIENLKFGFGRVKNVVGN